MVLIKLGSLRYLWKSKIRPKFIKAYFQSYGRKENLEKERCLLVNVKEFCVYFVFEGNNSGGGVSSPQGPDSKFAMITIFAYRQNDDHGLYFHAITFLNPFLAHKYDQKAEYLIL